MTPANKFATGAHADHDERHYRFKRQRQDWLYVPLEPTEPPIKAWGPHIAAGLGTLLLMALAFPAARLVVDLMAGLL